MIKEFNKIAVSGSDKDLTWNEFKMRLKTSKLKLLEFNLPKVILLLFIDKEASFIVSAVACMSLGFLIFLLILYLPTRERLNKIVNVVNSAVVINTIEDKIDFNIEKVSTEYFYERPNYLYYFTSGSTGEPKGVQITRD